MRSSALFVCVMLLFVTGCERAAHDDIKQFIEQSKRVPLKKIKSLPVYTPYKPYIYNAAQFRSPFEPPALVEKKVLTAKSNVKPDLARQKQSLEAFDFASLSMVGTVKKDNVLWGLIRDPNGSIERVKVGNYLGKNHGKIVAVSGNDIDVVEIVSNGSEGWLERPNLISIKQKK